MQAAAFATAPPSVVFVPPRVDMGQTVLWSYGSAAGEKPCPAIVTRVGTSNINLLLAPDGARGFTSKTGVRHADDPFLMSMPEHDSGCWRKTPRDIEIDALLASFGGDAATSGEE